MPTLNWIGKEQIINHHNDVPFRVLERKYTFGEIRNEKLGIRNVDDCGDQISNSTFQISNSKIIHGDNLEALKALLPEYEGRIKCIYIDPPYNTGNENWVYNDNVNSPKIRKWLGQVVGKESEDLSRHDKWLCMMYPRLVLLQKLLHPEGAIFISIDDNEQANLKLICDEIFGANNFVEIFSWRKTYTPSNLSHTSKKSVEYIYCYSKNRTNLNRFKGLLKVNEADNPLIKSNNQYKILIFPHEKVISTLQENCFFKAGEYGTKINKVFLKKDVEFIDGKYQQDIVLEGKFIWTQEMLDSELAKDTKIIFKGKSFAPRYDRVNYNPEVPRNLIDYEDNVGTTEEGGKILNEIFGKKVFDYPKVPSLIEYIINFLCDKNSIILDSFAGSGTTAHAVLNLNKADGGNRKFILVEMEDYAETITAERVKRVIDGYGDTEGTGGSFDYYELGEPVFDADGNLNENIGTEKIREYIWYSEIRNEKLGIRNEDDCDSQISNSSFQIPNSKYFLGKYLGTAYYFYYEKDQITTLDKAFLNTITQRAEQYVIYADNCLLSAEFMQANHIIFKKIPRDVKKL